MSTRTLNGHQASAVSGLLLWAASQGKLGCVTLHATTQEDMALCVLLWILNSFATGISVPMSITVDPELGSQWQSLIVGFAFRVITLEGKVAVSTIPLPELEFTQSRAGFAKEVLRSVRRMYGKSDPGPSTAHWIEQLDRELAHNRLSQPSSRIEGQDEGVGSCLHPCAQLDSARKARYPTRRRTLTSVQAQQDEAS